MALCATCGCGVVLSMDCGSCQRLCENLPHVAKAQIATWSKALRHASIHICACTFACDILSVWFPKPRNVQLSIEWSCGPPALCPGSRHQSKKLHCQTAGAYTCWRYYMETLGLLPAGCHVRTWRSPELTNKSRSLCHMSYTQPEKRKNKKRQPNTILKILDPKQYIKNIKIRRRPQLFMVGLALDPPQVLAPFQPTPKALAERVQRPIDQAG